MKMKRRAALGVALGLVASGVAGLSGSVRAQGAGGSAEAQARAKLPSDLRGKGVLTAGMPLDFEPFNSLNDQNRPVGLDVDVFEAVAKVLGLKPDIQRMGFASVIPAVDGGRVDVGMSAMSILPVRLAQVSFVRYARAGNGLIVRHGNPSDIRTTDGCGHSIAAEKGTQPLLVWQKISQQCEASGKPKIDLLMFDGAGPQVLAVEAGRAEAGAVTYASAVDMAAKSGGRLAVAPGGLVPGGTTDCGIAFKKSNIQLGEAIDAALKVMVADGSYNKIFEKWHLQDAESAPLVVTKA